MADTYDQEKERRSSHRAVSQSEVGPGAAATTSQDGAALYPNTLLGHANLGGRGNGPARIAAMQGAQQSHGNRAVQRFIQRTVAVQRDPHDSDELLRLRQRRMPAGPLSATDLLQPLPLTSRTLALAGTSPGDSAQQGESNPEAPGADDDAEGVQVPLDNRVAAGVDRSGVHVRVGERGLNATLGYNPIDGTVSAGVAGERTRRADGSRGTAWNAGITANPGNRSVGTSVGVGRWSGTGNMTFNDSPVRDDTEGGGRGPVGSADVGVTYRPATLPAITGTAGYDFNRRQGTLGVTLGGATPPLEDARAATDPVAAARAGYGLIGGIADADEQSHPQPAAPRPSLHPLTPDEMESRRREQLREEARRRAMPAGILSNINAGANLTIDENAVVGAGITVGGRF